MTERAICKTCGSEQPRYAGPSILQLMEKELDRAIRDREQSTLIYGLATQVAILRSPYSYMKMKQAVDFDLIVENVISESAKRVASP